MPVVKPLDPLAPYRAAATTARRPFDALLWSSPASQRVRFDALLDGLCGSTADCRTADPNPFAGRVLLDVGCGQADVLDVMAGRDQSPDRYVGVEGIPSTAAAARRTVDHFVRHGRIRSGDVLGVDFVASPDILDQRQDVAIVSGSLNTLPVEAMRRTLCLLTALTRERLAFNFLSGRQRAGNPWLVWHREQDVSDFVRSLPRVRRVETLPCYLVGDTTLVVTLGRT